MVQGFYLWICTNIPVRIIMYRDTISLDPICMQIQAFVLSPSFILPFPHINNRHRHFIRVSSKYIDRYIYIICETLCFPVLASFSPPISDRPTLFSYFYLRVFECASFGVDHQLS